MLPQTDAMRELAEAGVGQRELILYTTSMTNDRQVRDHCRLLKNLLYVRRIEHSELDIADNAFLQRRLEKLCGGRFPMPLLFVGEQFIGNYPIVQELEDNGTFMEALAQRGFQYKPLPMPKVQATHLIGISSDDDD